MLLNCKAWGRAKSSTLSGATMKLLPQFTGRGQSDAYFPPFHEFSKHLFGPERGGTGRPTALLTHILAELSAHIAFDEDYYVRTYPDVARAIENGSLKSGREHYVKWGYFEGRRGSEPAFDQNWYSRKYPDLLEAQSLGLVGDLREHFYAYGIAEGRLGSQKQFERWQEWQELFAQATPRTPADAVIRRASDGLAAMTQVAAPASSHQSG